MTWLRWTAAIERHHRAIIAASAVLCVLCALSLTRLRLDIDVLTMLPRGEPAFDDFKAFVADFGQLDELLVMIEGGTPAARHRFADGLAERLRALDGVREVHARVDTQHVLDGIFGRYLFNYISEDAFARVEQRLTPDGIDAQVARNRAILAAPFDLSLSRQVADDPLGLRRIAAEPLGAAYSGVAPALEDGYFASRDGEALLLLVRPTGSPFDVPFSEKLLADVRGAVAETREGLGDADGTSARLRLELGGGYAFAVEDAATMKADIFRYAVLALLGVLAVFYVGYGNVRILPFVTYPLVVSTLVTFALSLLIFDQLNAVSLSFDAVLYGLSIDSGIHFYTRLLEERRRGVDARSAIAGTLAGLGRAHLASSSTTAVAFVVIGFSVLGAVQQLGVLTAIGMGLTTLQFFTLYPALGFVVSRHDPGRLRDLDTPRLAAFAAAAVRRARIVRAALVIAAIVCAAAALQIRLDPSLTTLRPADSPAMRLQEEIASRFVRASAGGAVLVRRADLDSALVDAERLATVLRGYQIEGAVRRVQAVDAILPSEAVQRRRLARADAWPRAAATDRLRTALAANGFKPERFQPALDVLAQTRRDIVRFGDPALAPLQLVIDQHVRGRDGAYMTAVYVDPGDAAVWPDVAARLRRDVPDLEFGIAARSLLEHELHRVLGRELVLFLILSAAGNLALLVLILRSVRTGLAVFAPVMLVVLALFAGMWLAGVAVDPINLVVTPLILGIGVDEGVYLAAAARERGRIVAAMRSFGRALIITSFTTIAGFGFLAFSNYPPLATMGALVAFGLTLCLFTTVLVLPALLAADRPDHYPGEPSGEPYVRRPTLPAGSATPRPPGSSRPHTGKASGRIAQRWLRKPR